MSDNPRTKLLDTLAELRLHSLVLLQEAKIFQERLAQILSSIDRPSMNRRPPAGGSPAAKGSAAR